MTEANSLADLLSEYMKRAHIGDQRLANLVNDLVGWNLLNRSTIRNWREGTSRSVQDWRQIAAIAAVLKLEGWEANLLLAAAGQPPLSILPLLAGGRDQAILGALPPPPAPGAGSGRVPFLAPPRPSRQLVGRDDLLRQIKQQLLAGNTVAISALSALPGSALSGLPGVGKTALALTLAHDPDIIAHFGDGILWIGLGQQPDLLALLGIWAKALGIHESEIARLADTKERAQAINREIGDRRMLLIIDDAWEAGAAATFKIGGSNCAHLLTTRSPDIARSFALEYAQIVPELSAADSLTLLARFVPEMVANEPEAAQALVQAAGGLPLALTLMGRYLQKESLTGQPRRLRAALERLQETKTRLEIEIPVSPLEQQISLSGATLSLWASIELSVKVLSEPLQQALRALSLFPPKPNTFAEAAALAVTGAPLQTLYELNDAGLLESLGPERYALHQTIADYARLLFAGPAAAVRMVHYYVDYVETHQRDYAALDPEEKNVRAALEIAASQELSAALVQGVNAAYHFWDIRGLYELAETWLLRAEPYARRLPDVAPLATTLLYLGRTADRRGEYALAESRLQEGLALAEAAMLHELTSLLLRSLGVVVAHRGDYGQAQAHFQRGLTLARLRQQPERISALLVNLGAVATYQGRYKEAEAYYQEALPLARAGNQPEKVSLLLMNMGVLSAYQGAYAQAEAAYTESLHMAQALGHREMICLLRQNLGSVAVNQAKYEQAETDFQEGLALAQKLGHRERICALLENLGAAAARRGAYNLAQDYLTKGLDMARALGHPWLLSMTLIELGNLQLPQNLYEQAQKNYAEAQIVAQESGLRDLVALSLYGLAQIALAQGDLPAARQLGQESLAILESLAHRDAAAVKAWLAGLPAS